MKKNTHELDQLITLVCELETTYLERQLRLSGVVAFDQERTRYAGAAQACRKIINQAIAMRDKPKPTWRQNPVIAWAFRHRSYLRNLLTA